MEFMDQGLLPVPEEVLSQQAFEVRSFAKALHYREREFHRLVDAQKVLERARASSNASTRPQLVYPVLAKHRAEAAQTSIQRCIASECLRYWAYLY